MKTDLAREPSRPLAPTFVYKKQEVDVIFFFLARKDSEHKCEFLKGLTEIKTYGE